MNDLRTAAQQALEALKKLQGGCTDSDDGTVEAITVWCPEVIENLEAALEQPEQEPVAWMIWCHGLGPAGLFEHKQFAELEFEGRNKDYPDEGRKLLPLYTHPPRREWRGLTEEEIIDAVRESDLDWHQGWTLEDGEPNRYTQLTRAIEAALKERNA